ncbi:Peptidase M50B-like [Quadrisphaera granulorum]|uniref:Peptidase M50B-like protein n=1 Tax=Quadrisphaera granulorum TaxID=317664 RepID=A0A316AIT2_9ACTN|nr:M50 family metallopeptidase [Quadrisphaera granulorum]PWJ49857.1 peptidase M50B-like protein [Quadrisphaera granulorum]SZE98065.1 Peptidase M50B-like [Quadrisphaera granulorum]
MSWLFEVWARATALAPPLPLATAVATGIIALAVVVWRPSWRVWRAALVLAHEGGHGLVATVVGRRLRGIRMHPDASAVTVSVGPARGLGVVAVLLAGYPAPALVGLGAAALLAAGRPAAVLWAVLLALALLAVQVRGWRAVGALAATALPTAAVTWWASATVLQVVAALLAWGLLLGAPRGVAELARSRRRGRSSGSDADQLGRLTGVPAVVWVSLFALVTAGAAAWGGSLLLGVRR